jgi:Fuc2NAc and GlcNAc transferase
MAADSAAPSRGGKALKLLLAWTLAASIAALATFPLRRYARLLGLMDAPNARSSHRVITPRGGGLAMIAAVLATAGVFSARSDIGTQAWILLSGAGIVGALGAADDRRGLSPLVRLFVQIAAAALLVVWAGTFDALPLPGALHVPVAAAVAIPLSVLWMVAVTNFFNFMDGIDGLACGQAIASCLGIAVAWWSSDAAAIAVIVAGAAFGFLLHNWPPARVFMGDSGSGFLGFALSAAPFLAPAHRRDDALLAVAVGLSLFILDPLTTLARRARAGKNVLQAHREHLYQQLVPPNESSRVVTSVYALAAFVLAMAGAAGYRQPSLSWLGVLAAAIAFVVLYVVARRRETQTAR